MEETIIIGDREDWVYITEAISSLQKSDQIIWQLHDGLQRKAMEIKNYFGFLGILIEERCLSPFAGEVTSEMKKDFYSYIKTIKNDAVVNYQTEVKFATRDWRFYVGITVKPFARNDTVVLSMVDSYLGNAFYVPQLLNTVGIEISKEYRNSLGRMEIKKKMEKCINERNGRVSEIEVNKLGLSKGKELQEMEEVEICTTEFAYAIRKEDLDAMFAEKLDWSRVRVKGKIIWKKESFNNFHKQTGRIQKMVSNQITLTKMPELFMFTDPSKALVLPAEA